MPTPLFFAIAITMAGYAIGLGAVTVIDLHGFLGRTSSYWTEATTRTHKVTKPLIWIGTALALLGGLATYTLLNQPDYRSIHIAAFALLIANGCFLSFSVSPYLLQREREGKGSELLPNSWQEKITASFIVSFLGWWLTLSLFAYALSQ